MSGRDAAVAAAAATFDDGRYAAALAELVTYRTESRDGGRPEGRAGGRCSVPRPAGRPNITRPHRSDDVSREYTHSSG